MTALAVKARAHEASEAKTEEKVKTLKNRVQFDLPPRSMERLAALKAKTEAASYAEVMKNALRLYEALIEEVEQGRSFYVRDEQGNMVPYKMFL
jgi:hypothetical protein